MERVIIMKFSVYKTDNHFCDWGVSPPMYVIHCEKQYDEDDEKLREIITQSQEEGLWALSNLVYFDTEEEANMFILKWI